MHGGTTPLTTLFKQILAKTNMPINILIRQRFVDFLYTESEFLVMYEHIKTFTLLGTDGIVCRCLLPDGNLDIIRMQELLKLCKNPPFTLHRTIYVCMNPYKAIDLGISNILISEQKFLFRRKRCY